MAESNSKNYSIFAVILGVACLVLGYFLYNNFWTDYTLAQDQFTQAEVNNTELTHALDSVQTFLNNYESQKQNAALTKLALPDQNPDLANFLNSVADLASASGVALVNVQLAPDTIEQLAAPVNSIQVKSITLIASGIYPSLKDFMLRLEGHLRLIDVLHVTVTTTSETNGVLQYQIKLRTYYQK